MKSFVAATILATSLAFSAVPQAQAAGVKIGVLNCRVDGGVGFVIGSSKDVRCVFHRSNGRIERYKGSIGKLGVDLGITGEADLGWVVFAPGLTRPGSLKGSYTGASAEATVGIGLGANVLVGGFRQSINLQPISIQAQTGLNVAAGVASLHLKPVR